MRNGEQIFAVESLEFSAVECARCGVNVRPVDQHFRQQLIAVTAKLVAESGQRVESMIFCGDDFEFVVDEQIEILACRHLLLPGLYGIVLVVGVQKFATGDGTSPDAKQNRLV